MQRDRIVLFGILILTIGLGSIQQNTHDWGDDFAMYLMHAENIISGEEYGNTGYIFNELAPMYAPQDYAPGFPVILAPAMAIFGQDLLAIKLYLLAFYAMFLWFIYVLLRDLVPNYALYGVILLIGTSAYIVTQTQNILSDIPGAALFLAALVYFKRLEGKQVFRLSEWILLGCLIYLAFSVRATSIVIIPAILLHAGMKNIALLKSIGALIAGFAGMFVLVSLLVEVRSNYLSMLQLDYRGLNFPEIMDKLGDSTTSYFHAFSDLFIGNMHNIATNTIVFYLLFTLFVAGWILEMWRSHCVWEWLVLGYWVLVILWPGFQGLRYFLPILPLYFYYALVALRQLPWKWMTPSVGALIFILGLISSISGFVNAKDSSSDYGISSSSAQELIMFLQEQTADDAIFMAAKPRAICYLTDKSAIVFPDPEFETQLLECMQQHKVSYAILTSYPSYPPYGEATVKADTVHFQQVFRNEQWEVYAFRSDR